MGKRQESHKDGKYLLKISRNFGIKICDEGSFIESKNGKHPRLRFRYKGLLFSQTFVLSGGSDTMKNNYKNVRNNLKRIGVDKIPNGFFYRYVK
jgi:hypothetical protein